jgi:hypothetical protein
LLPPDIFPQPSVYSVVLIRPHVLRPIWKEKAMLWTIAIILLVLWALGALAFHVGSGLIHLLLVLAVIVVVYQLVTGRRTL